MFLNLFSRDSKDKESNLGSAVFPRILLALKCIGSFDCELYYRQTLFYCIFLYLLFFTVNCFLQVEGLWQCFVKQVYKFVIIIILEVICDP